MTRGGGASATWTELDAAVWTALGVGLEMWRPGLATSPLPALRAWIEESADGRPDQLVLEAAGRVRIDTLPLVRREEGSWSFHHRERGFDLSGGIQASGSDLLLTVSAGNVTFGGLALEVHPSQLLLAGASAE